MQGTQTRRLGCRLDIDFQFVKEHFKHFVRAESGVHDKSGSYGTLRCGFMRQQVLQAVKQGGLASADWSHRYLQALARGDAFHHGAQSVAMGLSQMEKARVRRESERFLL